MHPLHGSFHGLTLLQKCGSGGFGEVWLGRDISGKVMAVKIVSKSLLGSGWERELQGVVNYRRISDSPELLTIFHVEEDEDSFFYTMEAADSLRTDSYEPDTLGARLQQGPLPETQLLTLLSEILAGIRVIHNAGFAHRDIKPDNILFLRGHPKLGDIGLVSSLDHSITKTAGTPDFLPPEIRSGEAKDRDRKSRQKSDLYAFGKVIYCSVTGKDPGDFPSLPPGFEITPARKLLLRLSFRLCDRTPGCRMQSLPALENEWLRITRQVRYGEKAADRLRFILRCTADTLRRWYYDRRGTAFLLILFLVLGGSGVFCWHAARRLPAVPPPPPPAPVSKPVPPPAPTVKEFVSQHRFKMTIPASWEPISSAHHGKMWESIDRKGPEPYRKLKKVLEPALKNGAEIIACDFSGSFVDNVTIMAAGTSADSEHYRKMTEEEIRLQCMALYQGRLGFKTVIYGVKRTELAGLPVVIIDMANDPDLYRVYSCSFCLPDRLVTITLAAKIGTFPHQQEEFRKVLATLQFSDARNPAAGGVR